MKNKNLFFKIYIPFVFILMVAVIILSILGNKIRIGYLNEVKLNINETLQLNNLQLLASDFKNEQELKNYLLNNKNISNYSYSFKMGYYDKVFKHSDIYEVYPDFSNLPKFIKEIKMLSIGNPFGNFVSDKPIEEKVDNIKYTLKMKNNFYIYFLSLIPSLLIYLLVKKFLNKYISLFKNTCLPINYTFKFNILNNFLIKFTFVMLSTIIVAILLKIFGLSNVNTYIISLIFISLYFLLISNIYIYIYRKLISQKNYLNKEKSEIIIYFIVLFSLLSVINSALELQAFTNQNFIILFIEFILLSIIFIIFANNKYNKYISVLLALVSIILISYNQYHPAINDNYHYSAHFNSVFMVYNSIPYQQNMYSIHGHYALFMYPFLKIFGLNIKSYSVLIAVLSGISSLCIILSIFILIKNYFYRIIGILTTLFFLFTIGQHYYSVFPLKIFFPSIIMLYVSIIGNRKNKLLMVIEYILAALGILWGADTGLVCIGALFIKNTYVFSYDLNFYDKKFYYNIALFVILSILSIFMALLILNICNIYILGGKSQTIKDLLFPLFTGQSKYTENNTRYPISYWISTIIIFLFSFLYYIKDMRIFNFVYSEKFKPYSSSIIFCSVCGLGLYCYYMNRSDITHHMIAVGSLSVIIPFSLYRLNIMLFSMKEEDIKNYKYILNIIKAIFFIYSIIVIFISISNFTNILNPNFYKYMHSKNDEKNGITYIITEYMKKYGYNGIASFGGAFVYGYANLGWTNSLILPNESDWWNPSFGYSNAVKIFLDKKPDMFLSEQYLKNLDVFYHNEENERNIYLFNRFINLNYTNIQTEYERYGFYLYKLK